MKHDYDDSEDLDYLPETEPEEEGDSAEEYHPQQQASSSKQKRVTFAKEPSHVSEEEEHTEDEPENEYYKFTAQKKPHDKPERPKTRSQRQAKSPSKTAPTKKQLPAKLEPKSQTPPSNRAAKPLHRMAKKAQVVHKNLVMTLAVKDEGAKHIPVDKLTFDISELFKKYGLKTCISVNYHQQSL